MYAITHIILRRGHPPKRERSTDGHGKAVDVIKVVQQTKHIHHTGENGNTRRWKHIRHTGDMTSNNLCYRIALVSKLSMLLSKSYIVYPNRKHIRNHIWQYLNKIKTEWEQQLTESMHVCHKTKITSPYLEYTRLYTLLGYRVHFDMRSYTTAVIT